MNCKNFQQKNLNFQKLKKKKQFSPYRTAQLAKGMLAFGIFITHGLACYVAIDIAWNQYIAKKVGTSSHKLLWEYSVRTLLVLITCKLHPHLPSS